MDNIDKQINDIFFSINTITPEMEYEAMYVFVHDRILFNKLKSKLYNEHKTVIICCKLNSDPIEKLRHRILIKRLFDFYIDGKEFHDFLASESSTVYQKVLEIHPNIEKNEE